jgi:2-amino-4-hydroxy-6-hydroxymethyldihydropteridine diphosphokinase
MAVYIALGANLGDRLANLKRSLELMPPKVEVEAVSPVYESSPQPPAPPPSYLNAACRVRTLLTPRDLLSHLKAIEVRMGREPAPRWHPRLIDLDIVLYDDQVVDEPDLVIPHPQLIQRNFVLQPLLDLDPTLRHPATGELLADVLRRVGGEGLQRLAEAL